MNFNTFYEQLVVPGSPQPIEADPASLYAVLAKIDDGRHKRGVRYPIQLLLVLVILAKLSGQTSLSGAAHWVRLRSEWLNHSLARLNPRKSWPCTATYCLAFAKLKAEDLNSLVREFFHSQVQPQPQPQPQPELVAATTTVSRPAPTATPTPTATRQCQRLVQVALDGKTLRGTLNHSNPLHKKVHVLSAYEVTNRYVLGQRQLGDKESEVSEIEQFLEQFELHGRVVTADAFHTQAKLCRYLSKKGAYYILIAKANRRALLEDLEFSWQGEWPQWLEQRYASSFEKGHGRLEKRELWVSSALEEYFAGKWAGLKQVFKLERQIERKRGSSREVVYGITNLSAEQAGAHKLLQLVRAHWRIENSLHWRRDVTLGEDASQVRSNQAPAVMAMLNNIVLGLIDRQAQLDRLKVLNTAAKRREYEARPIQALALLFARP